ncbi:MAG: right-handed parallel beta-helix repeat-containing protein [Clostridia bacterium]|nr:right-handed parallel beta-helix repeat-containing protein [Clostridia bacterium]
MKKLFCLLLCLPLFCLPLAGCTAAPATPGPAAGQAIPAFEPDAIEDPVYRDGWLNVTDFGAAGDGSTDDAAALQQAVDASLQEGGSRTLWFPAGQYCVRGMLTVPRDVCCVFARGASLVFRTFYVTFEASVTAGLYEILTGEFDSLLNNETVFPQWFGAAGDGVTDDTNAFRRALEHALDVSLPCTAGGYLLGPVDVPTNARVHGYNGKCATVVGRPDAEYIFRFQDGQTGCLVSDLIFRMGGAETAACFFFDAAGVQQLTHIEVYNIYTEGAWHVIRDAHKSGAIISDVVVRDMVCLNTRDIAFDTDNFWGFCFMRNCVFDNSGLQAAYGAGTGNCPAVSIGDNAGFILQNNRVVGTGDPGRADEHGFEYHNNVATWMDGCSVSGTGGDAFRISGGSHLYFSNITAEGMYGYGLNLTSSPWLQLMNMTVTGLGKDREEKQIGVQLKNLSNGQIDRLTVSGCSNNGVLAACTRCAFTNLAVSDCGNFGLIDAGTGCVYSVLTVERCAGGHLNAMNDKTVFTGATFDGQAVDSLTQAGIY